MKIKRIFIYMLLGAIPLHAEGVVDFEKSTNLKTLFDGGIRPWYADGMKNSTLEVENINQLAIKLPGCNIIHIDAERGDISVLKDNQLDYIHFLGKLQSLDEATIVAKKIADTLKLDASEMISTVNARKSRGWSGRIHGDSDPIGIRYNPSNKIGFQIRLCPMYGYDEQIHAQVDLYLTLNEKGGIPQSNDGPIQPPEGYENISLEKPKRVKDPNKESFPSKSQMAFGRALSQVFKTAVESSPELQKQYDNLEKEHDPELRAKNQEKRASGLLWVIAGAVIATLVGIGGWLKYRRRKKPKA